MYIYFAPDQEVFGGFPGQYVSKSMAKEVLKFLFFVRYKQDYLMFNDDIQGTAATVLAGLYGALRVQGLGPEALKDQV